ncbi:disease resistance protein RUN1-like [Rhodamnia argentea]|uniref:Disease resistance protein RUN1-like n=1 Tax=Rhodamnia argentea TaxID=178133 RepID=A0ABM3HAB5_9MYRT|nr:disease resistance protein RUN1-like [Rhodamnia argentea]
MTKFEIWEDASFLRNILTNLVGRGFMRMLLGSTERNEDVEALSLTSDGCSRNIALEEFAALPNLRFLRVRDIDIFCSFENLPSKLRWLSRQSWRTILRANNFHFSNLVMLDLSYSNIRDGWGGWSQMKMAPELKVLNLTSCHFLTTTPDFSALESLEILILEDCKNLEEIHPSIKDIKTLVSLNVSRCRRLKELPAGVGRMEELKELLLDHTTIKEIHISGDCLMKLETLSARGGSQLAQLPESMGSLMSLTKLDLSFTGIEELPESVGSLKKLETLDASNCALLSHIPDSIGHLTSLSLLNLSCCPKLAQLPYSIASLVSLQRLLLRECSSLTEISNSIGKLSSLAELDLKFTKIEELPESIEHLQNLRTLDIRDTKVTVLPGAIEMLAKLQLRVKKSPRETMPLKMSAPSILLPRQSMEKMKGEAGQRAADMETSDGDYTIAAVQNVVGIDDRAKQISDLLEMEVNDEVRILGIYGTDGIGKTTLAKAVYSRISSCFDGCCFLAEVEETAQNPHGIQFLRTKLKRDILGRDREDPSFDERLEFFQDIFREMKVLVVVDDVRKQSHLHAIVGKQLHWLGPGSRIIVTSKNEEILREYEPEKARTYMVSELDDGQAVELFRKHAFMMQSSTPDYDELANRIVNATEKLPLAVEVIGSFLRGKSIEEWEKIEKSMKLFTMSSGNATVGIEEIWYLCYRELDQHQKDIVLDIACFISGVDARVASYMWPVSSHPTSNCIWVPLARIGENNELQMHRLLRCFGKRILNQVGFGDRIPRKLYTQDMVPKAISREKVHLRV